MWQCDEHMAANLTRRVSGNRCMKFHPTPLADACLVELEALRDERGAFARTFCVREFAAHDLETVFVQHSASTTTLAGTVRGMHFQREPHGEAKLVRCVRGAVFDVMVDLRPASPTYLRWAGFELSADNGRQLFIPNGFAHGFQTLTDDVELSYLISATYLPEASAGHRYDDPAFGIAWPRQVSVIADKDLAWPAFVP